MSVRKRAWKTGRGVHKEAWVVDYADVNGVRRLKTFTHKKDADAFDKKSGVEIQQGTHVPDSASVTVKEAGALWIQSACEGSDDREPLERTTVLQYEQHLDLHIVPFIGTTKLSQLNVPFIRGFTDKLRAAGRSPVMVKKVRGSLGALLGDSQERGLIVRNPVREMRPRPRRAKSKDKTQDKHNRKLQIGIDIPDTNEIRLIVGAAKGNWRPLLLTAIFTGLRASELRGLRWLDVDLKTAEIYVRQRADAFKAIGPTKSEAGERTVPLPPIVANALRQWKEICPRGKLGLVFPNGVGNVESHANIINRALHPVMVTSGVTLPVLDEMGEPKLDEKKKPIVKPKYTGLHALRHFYASWCINRKQDGGLELPLKNVQARLGHSSIQMTADTYGHLFKSRDDGEALANAQRALLAS